MIVQETETIIYDNEHSIEFGLASWDNEVESIRRRKNNGNGTFDPISSSEIPINEGFVDIATLFSECVKRDKISIKEMIKVNFRITLSIIRKIFKFRKE